MAAALAVAYFAAHVSHALAPEATVAAPDPQDAPVFALHGGARLEDGGKENGIRLPEGSYAEWHPTEAPTTRAGSLILWISPLWPTADRRSRPFVTFRWSGAGASYFALSQGWWEPQGARKLYVVLSNQQSVACLVPWAFDYTLYLPGQWTMLAVTWQSGSPGFVRLSVDGRTVCERPAIFAGDRRALGPLFLGSDRGSTIDPQGRPSDMIIRRVEALPRALGARELRGAYLRGGGVDRPKWAQAIAPAGRESIDAASERRIIFDEDTGWAASRLEIQNRVRRIKQAGFNVYAPCIWDGGEAFYRAASAPISRTVRDPVDRDYDPLNYLIAIAHGEGIAVHPWIKVSIHRPGPAMPASYLEGAPAGAFNVHSREFRDFIVALAADVARRYDLDGVNLDYVRAMGPCTSSACLAQYQETYGRSLAGDWSLQEQGQTIPSLIEWNRGAVGDIVSRISAALRMLRPRAVLSVDTVPFDHSRQHQGLDEEAWLRSGLIDALVDMAYDYPIDIDTLDRAMKAFTPGRQVIAIRDYDVFGDEAVERSGDAMSDYVRLIRARWPGAGVGFYQYRFMGTAQALALSRDVFKQSGASGWIH